MLTKQDLIKYQNEIKEVIGNIMFDDGCHPLSNKMADESIDEKFGKLLEKFNQLAAMTTEFSVGPRPIINGILSFSSINHVLIRNMGQPNHWEILSGVMNLAKSGRFEYPSNSKDDEFFEKFRYDTAEEAIQYAQHWIEEVKRQAEEILKAKNYVNFEDLTNLDFDTLMAKNANH